MAGRTATATKAWTDERSTLAFVKGDRIANVKCDSGPFWVGTVGEKTGWFPKECVLLDELNRPDDQLENMILRSKDLMMPYRFGVADKFSWTFLGEGERRFMSFISSPRWGTTLRNCHVATALWQRAVQHYDSNHAARVYTDLASIVPNATIVFPMLKNKVFARLYETKVLKLSKGKCHLSNGDFIDVNDQTVFIVLSLK